MKIGIIHISDIHTKNVGDSVLNRGKSIVATALGAVPSADAYLLALTGDFAYSGLQSEFNLAKIFLNTIRDEFARASRKLFIVLTPGNHDLDFTKEPDTRPLLLKSLPEKIATLDPYGESVKQLVSTQDAFFSFEASVLNEAHRTPQEYLVRSHSFAIGTKTICVVSYNTAWVSTNPEKPGQLLFPIEALNRTSEPTDLVISMFHHPYNWLAPENARSFRHAVEASSDIVLTGHEHESDIYARVHGGTAHTQYIEGAVLQEHGSERSGFNALCIDTDGQTYESFRCDWQEDGYMASSLGSHQFIRNRLLCKSQFRISGPFLEMLKEPAVPMFHPKKHDVQLDDLYVYPDMSCRASEKPQSVTPRMVYGDDVVEFIRETEHTLILGDDMIGKTSFARKVFRDLHSDGTLVPLLIKGSEFKGFSDRDLRKLIRAAVTEQYDEFAVDRYFQLEQGQRVGIIDDWHENRYNVKGRAQIIRYLRSFFGKVICFTNRLHAFDELSEPGATKTAFADFQFCEIKGFGKRLTGRLIEKWHMLGTEYSLDLSEFHYAVATSEHKIDSVVGKGLLPAYPIFLIGLLQADASPSSSIQNAGSYGHVLEALITARLTEVRSRSTDIGLLYTYISRLAYFLFRQDRPVLSAQELSVLHQEYCTLYKMKVAEGPIINDLVKAKIIVAEGDSYRFRYRGCYCYFVARYFAEHMNEGSSSLRAELNEITDKLVYEDFTCIVMFVLYLTRDSALIERILANASAIYADCEPSNLEDDVAFVNKLLNDKPEKLVLPSADIAANRDRFRQQQDEANGGVPEGEYRHADQRVAYAEGLDEIVKVNIALQSLRVMGQVLRNFPGVLTGEPKYRLTEASCSAPL